MRFNCLFDRLTRLNSIAIVLALLPAAQPGAFSRLEPAVLAQGGFFSGLRTCALPAPASFDSERTGATTAYLTWSPVSGAVSYRLTVYDTETWTLISNTIEFGTSKDLTGLSSGATYRCVLASMCEGGASSEFIIWDDVLDI